MIKEVCSQCGYEGRWANRTRKLCIKCNQERLSKGKPKKVYEMKRTPLKSYSQLKPGNSRLKSNKKVSSRSPKGCEIDKAYREVVAKMKTQGDLRCNCCNTTERLSVSHLIPRSYSESLITNRLNLVWHCMSFGGIEGCHDKWETASKRIHMADYEENMEKVKKLDIKYFYLLKSKEEEWLRKK